MAHWPILSGSLLSSQVKDYKKDIDLLEQEREQLFQAIVQVAERLKKGTVRRIRLPTDTDDVFQP